MKNQSYLFRRYIWLYDLILRRGPLTFAQISDSWQKSALSNGDSLRHKTFENHRIAVEELFGVNIDCNRSTNTYYISENVSEFSRNTLNMLNNAILLNNVASDPDMRRFIDLEPISDGNGFLPMIIDALSDRRMLSISYRHNYDSALDKTYVVKPIAVKLFHQRWYLIAEREETPSPYAFALDRLLEVELRERAEASSVNVKDLFRNSYGITRMDNLPAENITLKVDREQANYLIALPLHKSQTIIARDSDSVTFRLRVAPTYDFIHELLSHGSSIEVVSPLSVRQLMKTEINKMQKNYD